MEKKWLSFFTYALMAGMGAAVILGIEQPLELLAQPFALIGWMLRELSLSGSVGNLAAIVLYIFICLSPLILGRKRQKEDCLLVLASAVMFYVMYLMVNPQLIPANLGGEFGMWICGGAVYSVLISWGVLKLLRAGRHMELRNVYRALWLVLMVCMIGCVIVGLGVCYAGLRADLAEIQAANTMDGLNLVPTYVFRVLLFAASAVEYCLTAVMLRRGAELVKELEKEPYSENCVQEARKTALWCGRTLMAVTLMNLALNLGQLFFASILYNIDTTVRIPVVSIAIAFGMLALARLLSQGKALKDDNDLFV